MSTFESLPVVDLAELERRCAAADTEIQPDAELMTVAQQALEAVVQDSDLRARVKAATMGLRTSPPR